MNPHEVEATKENRRPEKGIRHGGYKRKFGRKHRTVHPVEVSPGSIEEKEQARKRKAAGIPLWAKAWGRPVANGMCYKRGRSQKKKIIKG